MAAKNITYAEDARQAMLRGVKVGDVFKDQKRFAVVVRGVDAIQTDMTALARMPIYTPGGGTRYPATHESVDERLHFIKMRGNELFKVAVRSMYDMSMRVLDECRMTPGDIDLFIPHQANQRITNAVAERLGVPDEKIYANISRIGNTSSASIPIALDEAVRESIGSWYTAAIDAARIAPVGEPQLDLDDLPGQGEPLRFSIEIGVRPPTKLGDYKGLEVPRREPEVGDEAITEEIERLRERSAKLETADRPAQRGDFVVMDFVGSVDGTADLGAHPTARPENAYVDRHRAPAYAAGSSR